MYEEVSAPLISGTLRKMHHNMFVRPLGLFQINIVSVMSGTLHLHFQLHDLHEETRFQQKIGQALLGSSNQQKVPTSLLLFLTSGKIPGLLCIGN